MASQETTYHLPPVGNITYKSRQESSSIHDFLLARGEIERLKRLDHLGIIRLVREGAHHPRWEYVALILHLIDKCVHAPQIHVGGRVTLQDGTVVSSGAELLKSWALLLNVGHLEWTFMTERALLFEIARSGGFMDEFATHFADDSTLEQWVRNVVTQTRAYQFFQALALIRLDAWRRNYHRQAAALSEWRQFLRSYIISEGSNERLEGLRRLYRSLRRVAYMSLDTHYTPSALRLDLGELLSDERALEHFVLLRQPAQQDELGGLEKQLYDEIYLGPQVLRAIASVESDLRARIRRRLNHSGLHRTLEALASGSVQHNLRRLDLDIALRLGVWADHPWTHLLLEPVNPRIEQ